MTLKECYAAMEGNFDDVISRLRNEKIVRKLVIKFLNDDTYSLLCGALEAQHPDEAFRAAHTLKGICQNLSFTKLYLSSSRLTGRPYLLLSSFKQKMWSVSHEK